MTTPDRAATAAAIRSLQAAGVSIPQMARAVGRDPSFLRQVAAGKKVGASLLGPLEMMRKTGRVTSPPPRRTGASGQPARVRAPRSAGVASWAPPAAPRTSPTYMAGGGQVTRIEVPRSAAGRADARAELLRAIKQASAGKQRLTFHVETRDGRRLTLGAKGGYGAARGKKTPGLRRQVIYGHGGDAFGWLLDQLDAAGYEVSGLGGLLAVDVVAFG